MTPSSPAVFHRSLVCAALALAALGAASPSRAVTAVEAAISLGTSASITGTGTLLSPRTALTAGASALHVAPSVSALNGASVNSTGSADLSFTSESAGMLTMSWLGQVNGTGALTTYSEGVYSLAVAGSIYAANNDDRAMATYAFIVDGGGSVAIDWRIWVTDHRDSEAGNNFNWGRRAIQTPASLFVLHGGSLAQQVYADPVKLRSTGSTSLSFTALAGDVLVLRLFPLHGIDISGSGPGLDGTVNEDVTLSFAITAVPEPRTDLALLAGLGMVAGWLRRRPQRIPGNQQPSAALADPRAQR